MRFFYASVVVLQTSRVRLCSVFVSSRSVTIFGASVAVGMMIPCFVVYLLQRSEEGGKGGLRSLEKICFGGGGEGGRHALTPRS